MTLEQYLDQISHWRREQLITAAARLQSLLDGARSLRRQRGLLDEPDGEANAAVA